MRYVKKVTKILLKSFILAFKGQNIVMSVCFMHMSGPLESITHDAYNFSPVAGTSMGHCK